MSRQLKPLAIGVLGALLALALWHGYQDHQTFHALLAAVTARTAAPAR